MTRDTFKALGGRQIRHDGASQQSAGPGRLRSRLRSLCVVLCCALAFQPSLLTPGRGTARAASRPRTSASGSLTDRASRSLFALVAAVEGGIRQLLPDRESGSHASAGREAAFEPEPAAAFLIGAPSALTVTETHDSRIVLSWPEVVGAAGYRVERSPNLLTPYQVVGQPLSNGFEDTSQLTRGHAYLYRVRAVDAVGERSAPSPVAMATAIDFEDPELVAGVTRIKAAHVNDLRLAVAGVRGAALLSTSWQETVSSGGTTPVRAEHVRELRRELDEGLARLGLPVGAYEDTPLNGSPNGTPVRKLHFEQLRERSTRGTGVTGSGISAYDFASARLDPANRTGAGGVDLYSGNFNWSLSLVSLPGRAGLDLGLSLTYNSKVWTRSGDYILFDGDGGWPAPGFRLGFAVVQGKFIDTQAQKAAYMLVTPAGARVSLRQTAVPAVYEAGDSSSLQLTEEQDGSLTLVAPGGTRMTYRFSGGVFKCTEIKDSDGNFITVAYTVFGNVDYVTDTPGRLIDFDYHTDGYLKEIRQTWHREVETQSGVQTLTETHRWAKFEYDDPAVRTNFPGMEVFGPTGGQPFHALKRVTLADDSSFVFNYTTWGQVYQIEGRAKDNGLLNRVTLGLPADETQPQADCPRPSARRDWAAYANGDADGVPAQSEELVTSYEVTDGATWNNPEDNQPQTGRLGQMTSPDGTVYKEYAHPSGWDEGLARLTEIWSGGVRKKWTSAAWTQDSEALSYLSNPRVRETNVYDSNEDGSQHSRRRTEVVYTSFSMPQEVREYDKDASTVLRRTVTEYLPESVNAGGAYTNRRIIGLPSMTEVRGKEGSQEKLFSKVTYEYDQEPGCLTEAGAVTQHKAEYDAGFTLRGNLCVARRWDVNNLSQSVASKMGYDTAGSVVFTRDADGHETHVEYAAGAGALAYPTKVTDPDGFFSTLEYNYDTGAVTRAVDPKGAAVKTFYDSVGRRLKVRSEVNNAYTKWEYGESGLFVKTMTKVDTNEAETFVMSVADGAGGTVGTLREHPGDGTGYAASRTEYDAVNRVAKQYKPAEVSVDSNNLSNARAWVPAGEDAAPEGWPHSATYLDWKGRPKRVVGVEEKDQLFEYGGCGCAGGEVVTAKGEEVPAPVASGVGRRAQRVHHDILGRPWMTEVLNWDGTVYTATTTKYDALDRAVRVRQYEGEAPADEPAGEGPSYRTTTMTYDGHGRLHERHAPEQEEGRKTVYNYNNDDTVRSVTDARGVKAVYGYDNDRHLVSSVSYDLTNVLPGQNVQATAGVSFVYDSAGNRVRMTDGFGVVDYDYDALSRLLEEKRTFHDPQNSAVNGVVRKLNYTYNLAGQLKTVTDPFQTKVNYDYDKAGQLTGVAPASPYSTGGVNGAPVVQVSEFATGMKYRAWGALKGMSYGNGLGLSLTYTAGMGPDEFKVSGQTTLMWSKYRRYDDGTLKSVEDKLDQRFDRSYKYDQAGRLEEAFSGAQALSFVKPAPSNTVPYWQKYEYDAWGNTKKRENQYWSRADTYTANFDEHNRRQSPNGPLDDHDAEGNVVGGAEAAYTFDAAGLNILVTDNSSSWVEQRRDGEGQIVKRREERHDENGQVTGIEVGYYVRSSVLGGAVVSELDELGGKVKSRVYAGDTVLAELSQGWVTWRHEEPVTGARGESNRDGQFADTGRQFDPAGVNLGAGPPLIIPGVEPSESGKGVMSLLGGLPLGRCKVDGMSIDCLWAAEMRDNRTAYECPDGDCGPRFDRERGRYEYFNAYGDGWGGYMPAGARYEGGGRWYVNVGGGDPNSDDPSERPRRWRPERNDFSYNTAGFLTSNPQKSDCEQFVDELYEYALEAYGVNNGLGTGRSMALRAKNYYGRSKDAKGNDRFGIAGFKTELTENTQGADLYKHIMGQAGAILIGDNWLNPLSHLTSEPYIYQAQPGAKPAATGTELARANLARDRQQINDPRHGLEAIVEVRNDIVGEEIGNMILGTVNNNDSIHALRQKIFDKLCNK